MLMCNLSLADSKHREDAAQRGRLRRGAAIHQSRLTEGLRNRTAALRIAVPYRIGPQCAETYYITLAFLMLYSVQKTQD